MCRSLPPWSTRVVSVKMLTAERDCLAMSHEAARQSITTTIKAVQRQLDDIDAKMAAHVKKHHADVADLLMSAKGIGPIPWQP